MCKDIKCYPQNKCQRVFFCIYFYIYLHILTTTVIMRVLILCIFNETDEYNQMKQIQQKYVNSNDCIDYYFITYKPNLECNILLDGNTLYINGNETLMNILEKTIISIGVFTQLSQKNGITYDFVIRTNVSTILNYNVLIEYLHTLPTSNLYIGGNFLELNWLDLNGGITRFKTETYNLQNLTFFQGTCIIMSFDIALILLHNKQLLKYDIVDDVAIALFFKEYIPNIYNNIRNTLHLRPCFTENMLTDKSIIVRCRTENRNDDIQFMKNVVDLLFINNINNIKPFFEQYDEPPTPPTPPTNINNIYD